MKTDHRNIRANWTLRCLAFLASSLHLAAGGVTGEVHCSGMVQKSILAKGQFFEIDVPAGAVREQITWTVRFANMTEPWRDCPGQDKICNAVKLPIIKPSGPGHYSGWVYPNSNSPFYTDTVIRIIASYYLSTSPCVAQVSTEVEANADNTIQLFVPEPRITTNLRDYMRNLDPNEATWSICDDQIHGPHSSCLAQTFSVTQLVITDPVDKAKGIQFDCHNKREGYNPPTIRRGCRVQVEYEP